MGDDDKALVDMTEFARCPAFNIECQYVSEVDRLSAENERLRNILEQWLTTAREHLDTEVAGRTFEALERAK